MEPLGLEKNCPSEPDRKSLSYLSKDHYEYTTPTGRREIPYIRGVNLQVH